MTNLGTFLTQRPVAGVVGAAAIRSNLMVAGGATAQDAPLSSGPRPPSAFPGKGPIATFKPCGSATPPTLVEVIFVAMVDE